VGSLILPVDLGCVHLATPAGVVGRSKTEVAGLLVKHTRFQGAPDMAGERGDTWHSTKERLPPVSRVVVRLAMQP